MSKKHKQNLGYQSVQGSVAMSHEAEYRIIKHDLVKVLVLNVAYFVLIIGLYIGNQRSQFLDNLFNRLLNF